MSKKDKKQLDEEQIGSQKADDLNDSQIFAEINITRILPEHDFDERRNRMSLLENMPETCRVFKYFRDSHMEENIGISDYYLDFFSNWQYYSYMLGLNVAELAGHLFELHRLHFIALTRDGIIFVNPIFAYCGNDEEYVVAKLKFSQMYTYEAYNIDDWNEENKIFDKIINVLMNFVPEYTDRVPYFEGDRMRYIMK